MPRAVALRRRSGRGDSWRVRRCMPGPMGMPPMLGMPCIPCIIAPMPCSACRAARPVRLCRPTRER